MAAGDVSDDAGTARFTTGERHTLAAVLDEIIPPSGDGRLPGAGALGLATHVEAALQATPALLPVIAAGLATLDALATRRHGRGFAALAAEDRHATLNEHAASEHAFPPILVLLTYTGYYRHPRVVTALGLEPRPPHPQGYDVGPDDPHLLDAVRRRPPLYRTV
jgi:hypothetical protein